jgi:hypothetical protein
MPPMHRVHSMSHNTDARWADAETPMPIGACGGERTQANQYANR